jgi:hypothetical protein
MFEFQVFVIGGVVCLGVARAKERHKEEETLHWE